LSSSKEQKGKDFARKGPANNENRRCEQRLFVTGDFAFYRQYLGN